MRKPKNENDGGKVVRIEETTTENKIEMCEKN